MSASNEKEQEAKQGYSKLEEDPPHTVPPEYTPPPDQTAYAAPPQAHPGFGPPIVTPPGYAASQAQAVYPQQPQQSYAAMPLPGAQYGAPAMYGVPPPPGYPNGLDRGGERGEWAFEICGCFNDIMSCFLSACCPCVVEIEVGNKIGKKSLGLALCCLTLVAIGLNSLSNTLPQLAAHHDAHTALVVTAFLSMIGLSLAVVRFVLHFKMRTFIREKYNIHQDSEVCTDAVHLLCCMCCVLSQERSTVRKYERA